METFASVAGALRFAADKMQKNNLFTTERLFCDVYCFEAGQEQTAHTHAGSDKVYYVIEGTAHIRIADDERDVGPGTVVLAPAGIAHGVVNRGPARLTLLVLMAPRP